MAEIVNLAKSTLEETVKTFVAKGYNFLSSGLPTGSYSGIVDNVEEFISMRTYEKPNGAIKGGLMFAIRATISIDGGEAYKVYGFEETGAKKLLVTKDQLKSLEPGCSFSFEVSDKGYTSKVAIVKNEAVSDAVIEVPALVTA